VQQDQAALRERGLGLLVAFQGCVRLALAAAATLSSSAGTLRHGSRQLSAPAPCMGQVNFGKETAKQHGKSSYSACRCRLLAGNAETAASL
jgi:hypothetical protein